MAESASLDAYAVADELFGDVPLTTGQRAQLRALDHRYWQAVFDLLHRDDEAPGARSTPASTAPTLTPEQRAALRTMLEDAIREMATPAQRAALGWA